MITAKQLEEFFNYLKKSRVIFGPVEMKAEEISEPGVLIRQLEHFDELILDSRLPFYPFKEFFVPEYETLFEYKGAELKFPHLNLPPLLRGGGGGFDKVALFGVNLLDLKAVLLYDQVFEKDAYYQHRRQNILVIGHSLVPDLPQNIFEETFEENILEHLSFDIFLGALSAPITPLSGVGALNNAPHLRQGYGGQAQPPLNLRGGEPTDATPSAQGYPSLLRSYGIAKYSYGRSKKAIVGEEELSYAVFTGSSLGQKILNEFGYKDYTHIQFSGPVKEGKLDERMLRLKDKLENKHNQKIWDQLGARCIECGKCTIACPTCFCFRIDDRAELGPSPAQRGDQADTYGQRQRCWDSCYYQEFSEVASGHKFLSSTAQRIHFWYFHKFARIPKEFNFMGCVGCRRCAAVCPVGIDIAEVLKSVEES